MAVHTEVSKAKALRDARRYAEADAAIEQALARSSEFARDDIVQLLLLRAVIHDDYGRYEEAAEAFGQAASMEQNSGVKMHLTALALERSCRGGEADKRKRTAVRARLEKLVEEKKDQPGELVHVLWARARVLGGIHPDDTPSQEDLTQAYRDVRRGLSVHPASLPLLITQARLVRINAANATADRDEVIQKARWEFDIARDRMAAITSLILETPLIVLDFERARLEITARDWEAAITILERVVKQSVPTHQSAQVWLVYCQRLAGHDVEQLQQKITELLNGGPDGAPPPVVSPNLRAQLLTERAALLEPSDPQGALDDYHQAAQIRPRMSFAVRGRLRCMAMLGDVAGATALVDELRGDLDPDSPDPDIAVEIAEFWLSQSRGDDASFKTALELFDLAIGSFRHYGYAHERKVAALRARDRNPEAICIGAAVLEGRVGPVWGLGGLRIELGHCYLAAGLANSAIAQFESAQDDPSVAVVHRARAGHINALLWKRDLRAARQMSSTSTTGARLNDAMGWSLGASGLYAEALDRFAAAREHRPFEPSPVIGEARVLRLLGRPAEAGRRLRRVLDDWSHDRTAPIYNELGWAAIEERRYEHALRFFDDALGVNSRLHAALRGRIIATARLGRRRVELDSVIDEAMCCAKGVPRALAATLTESGLAMLYVNDHVAARAYFKEANELSPSISQRLLQGYSLLGTGLLAEAERCAAQAQELALRAATSDSDVIAILEELRRLALEDPPSDQDDSDQDDSVRDRYCQLLVEELRVAVGKGLAERVKAAWAAFRTGGSRAAWVHAIEREHGRAVSQHLKDHGQHHPSAMDDPDVLLLRGACLLARGHKTRAISDFRAAEYLCGPGTVPAPIAQSVAMARGRDHKAAVKRLELLLDPTTGSVRAAELAAWYQLELESDAVRGSAGAARRARIGRVCVEIVEREPSRVDAYVCLAAIAGRDERLDEALMYLEHAAAIAPGELDVLRERAAILLRAGDMEHALSCTTALLQQAPRDGRGHLIAGLAHLELDQEMEAVAALRRAMAVDRHDADAVLGLVTALTKRGCEEEALEVLDRVLRAEHRETQTVHLARARILHTMARERADALGEAHLTQALRDAHRGLRLARTSREEAEAHYHCGVILLAQRHPRTAVEALDRALNLNPNHRGALQARAITREAGADAANARLLRRAAYAVGGTASVLLFLVLVASAVAMYNTSPSGFSWTPISFVVFGLLAAIAAAGVLPRIAGVKLRQVEITIAPPPPPSGDGSPKPFDFGRIPLATLSGPSTYRITEVVPDLSGLPEMI